MVTATCKEENGSLPFSSLEFAVFFLRVAVTNCRFLLHNIGPVARTVAMLT